MFDRELIIPLVAIVSFYCIPLSAIAFYWWYHIGKSASETALKQAMVARGYSAKEIVHVLTNGKANPTNDPVLDMPPGKPVKAPSY